MDIKKALAAYRSQRSNAKRRGIGWELTFKQWCDWWGDDIERRGPHVFELSMQRIADRGPYRLDNIRKGHPRDNSRTYSAIHQNRNPRGPLLTKSVSAKQREHEDGSPDLGYRLSCDFYA